MDFACWTTGAWAAGSWVVGSWCPGATPPPTPTVEQPHLLVKLNEFILDDHDREGEDMLILALMETLLND